MIRTGAALLTELRECRQLGQQARRDDALRRVEAQARWATAEEQPADTREETTR